MSTPWHLWSDVLWDKAEIATETGPEAAGQVVEPSLDCDVARLQGNEDGSLCGGGSDGGW